MDETLNLVQGEIIFILENGNCFNFEKTYGRVNKLLLHGRGDRLYTCLRETLIEHMKSKTDSLVLETQNDFLQTINAIWIRHKTSMAHISNILMQMDRVYVVQNNVANVIDLGLQIFRDQIYRCRGINEKLRDTLLDLVRQGRNGEVVNSLAIKNVCQMLKDLGVGDRSIYETDFEQPFLQKTAEYYEVALQNYSTENNATSCFKDFKTRMIEECERIVILSLGDVTVARVVAVFEQVLMKTLKDTLLDIRNMLGWYTPSIDESEFELPFLEKSAESCKSRIINLSTENVVSMCVERVKSRLIELYRRSAYNFSGNFRRTASVEKELAGKLRDTIIKTIVAERNGEVVDFLATKNVLQILIILGMDDYFLYNGVVEIPEDFYKTEIQNCLAENSALKCIEMLKPRRIAISEWTRYYLDENTEAETVFERIEAELQKQMSINVEMKISGIRQNLKCRKSEQLGCICMYKQFSSCTQDSLISQSDVNEAQEDGGENCAITFIQNLLDLKQRVDHCSINLFKNDESSKRIFKAVHDIGFMQLMNGNPTIPEYLALFIDYKLRNVKISEQENEALLNETIVLFKFLLEKDLFVYHYRKHLAKRLLLNKTVSIANEKYVISQLKVECGRHFTTKLEGMIRDITISDMQMMEFREHTIKHGVSLDGIDLNLKVLTTGFWPIPSVPPFCNVPSVPMKAYESFVRFYLMIHNGRRLTLNPLLGSAELSVTILETTQGERDGSIEVLPPTSGTSDMSQMTSVRNNGPRKYVIVVSTYQMFILLLFNNRNELTYDEIKNETGMSDADLIRALQSLAMGKISQRILIKHPKTKEIESSDVFSVNDQFSSKLRRIKIQTVKAKRESEPKRKEIHQKVEEGRKYQIEAAVVRIMKAQKKLSHISLVVEVTEQLKGSFLPKPAEIKKGIEVLIEREYLARSADDRNVYTYLA